jgi:hypothetical protein
MAAFQIIGCRASGFIWNIGQQIQFRARGTAPIYQQIITTKIPAAANSPGDSKLRNGSWQMLCIEAPIVAQVKTNINIEIERRSLCREALTIAREYFPNLCAGGILPRHAVGKPVDLGHIAVALTFLDRCRRTKNPHVHTFDLRRLISNWTHESTSNVSPINLQLGAVIAAAIALGFEVQNWHGVTCYAPHALIGVHRLDVRRLNLGSRVRAAIDE